MKALAIVLLVLGASACVPDQAQWKGLPKDAVCGKIDEPHPSTVCVAGTAAFICVMSNDNGREEVTCVRLASAPTHPEAP